jgi:hypothetical protein
VISGIVFVSKLLFSAFSLLVGLFLEIDPSHHEEVVDGPEQTQPAADDDYYA